MTKYLSFPGLGIEPFHIDDTAFTVFGIDIKWYGIIITLGMVVAYLYARTRAKYEGITDDDMYDVTLFCVIFGIIGARLYYVLFKLDDFIFTDGSVWENVKRSFLAVINIRSGGLAIYGGLIAGVITAFIVARVKKIRFPVLLDVAAPAALIGQIVGRWGNFINIEAFGGETSLPWRMGIHTTLGNAGEWISETYVHPTFLYESLWNLVGFILIAIFYKKKRYNGQVFLFYMTWYGLGRCMIEGLRTDSLMLGNFRVSQLVAGATFLVGFLLFVLFWVKTPEPMKLAHALAGSALCENGSERADLSEIDEDEPENPAASGSPATQNTDNQNDASVSDEDKGDTGNGKAD